MSHLKLPHAITTSTPSLPWNEQVTYSRYRTWLSTLIERHGPLRSLHFEGQIPKGWVPSGSRQYSISTDYLRTLRNHSPDDLLINIGIVGYIAIPNHDTLDVIFIVEAGASAKPSCIDDIEFAWHLRYSTPICMVHGAWTGPIKSITHPTAISLLSKVKSVLLRDTLARHRITRSMIPRQHSPSPNTI
jgi:hypothetical protein